MPSVNRCTSIAATMAGAALLAAPGAGKRYLITAAWVTASDDNNLCSWAAIQGTFGGAPALVLQASMLTFMGNTTNQGIQCELLCDENTGLTATREENSGIAFCGVHYRIVNGTGTS